MEVYIVLCQRVQCGMWQLWQLWQCAFAPFSGQGGFDIVRHQSGAYAFSVPVWALPWWSSSLAIVDCRPLWCYSQYLGPTNNISPTLSSAKENILLWCQHLAYAMSISASKLFKSWDRPLPLLWKTSYGSHVVLWSAELVNDRSIQITSSFIIILKAD